MSKTLQTRIISKHDTKARWDAARGFIPLKGEIIIYDDLASLKIGDGTTYVQDLPFVDDAIKDQLLQHVGDTTVHVTAQEKSFWNNKVNIDDSYDILYDELENGNLIFSRNYNG